MFVRSGKLAVIAEDEADDHQGDGDGPFTYRLLAYVWLRCLRGAPKPTVNYRSRMTMKNRGNARCLLFLSGCLLGPPKSAVSNVYDLSASTDRTGRYARRLLSLPLKLPLLNVRNMFPAKHTRPGRPSPT